MKILIVSDIHGNFDNMRKVLKDNPNFDCMFLVGDLLAGPEIEGYNPKKLANLLNGYKDKIIAVRGNCDYEYDIKLLNFDINKLYINMTIDKKIFLMTHGHYYYRDHLPEIPYDILISGHTHVPILERDRGKVIINPGSITLPRRGSTKSYIVYEDHIFSLKDLDENKVMERIYI